MKMNQAKNSQTQKIKLWISMTYQFNSELALRPGCENMKRALSNTGYPSRIPLEVKGLVTKNKEWVPSNFA